MLRCSLKKSKLVMISGKKSNLKLKQDIIATLIISGAIMVALMNKKVIVDWIKTII